MTGNLIFAYVVTNGWAGRSRIPVMIVGETPKRYRVEMLEHSKLPKGWVDKGTIHLVPKQSVLLPETLAQKDAK